MNIQVINSQNSLLCCSQQVSALVKQVLEDEVCRCDEVSINLVDEITICQLHLDYFNDPSPTDCITFPIDEEEDSCYRLLGEIFVCPETAVKYAKEHHVDVYEEVTLYIVHGLLHLLGYDDIDEIDRTEMRAAEKRHMTKLLKLGLSIQRVA